MNSPLVARPAATILILREGADGPEVLLLRRSLASAFVGGAYVFPGGGVDEADADPRLRARIVGFDEERAIETIGVADARSYYVAALRELFEEGGLLLARSVTGSPLGADDAARLRAAHQRRTNGETFLDLLEREDLVLDMTDVFYVAHWVTPEGPYPRRFDTRFFLAPAPRGQVALHDQEETIASCWVRPEDALAAHERGEWEMIYPTLRTLAQLRDFPDLAGVLAWAATRAPVPRILPQVITRDGRTVIVGPGDPGYVA